MAQPLDRYSRLAVQRYRTRLFVVRLIHARPKPLDLVNLALAVIGAWSVFYSLVHWLPSTGSALVPTAVGAAIVLLVSWLVWRRLTRRPQDVFTASAASESRSDDLRKSMALGMRNHVAYDCLAQLYRPLANQIGQRCPNTQLGWPVDVDGRQCLVLTLAAPPQESLDDLIGMTEAPRDALWRHRVSEFASERQMFMTAIRRSVSLANRFGDEHGANVILDEIECGDRLRLKVTTASYGQIVRTSDSLINEFALFAHIAARSAFRKRPRPLWFRGEDILKVLPWRREVHSWDEGADLLLAPRGRASGLGVSMVLVDRSGGRASALVARRSSNVGTYPDVLHVIPSGMVNIHGDSDDQEASDLASLPRLTMMAEFIEECFDVEELSGHSVGNFAKRVDREIHSRGLATLAPELTGLAIDLLNLRTEVCAVLDLTEHASVVDEFNLSWEYTHNERLHTIDLERGTRKLDRTDFVQSGIGTVHLASAWLARHASDHAPSDHDV